MPQYGCGRVIAGIRSSSVYALAGVLTLLIASSSSVAQPAATEEQNPPKGGNCAALFAQFPETTNDGPLTERECALMLRVQKLERTVNSLQDVQARLAALE